jgi:hypothetical protein
VAQFVELAVQTHLPASGGAGLSALSRNHINALTADVIVALPGGPGTASEVVVEINGVMSRKRRSHDCKRRCCRCCICICIFQIALAARYGVPVCRFVGRAGLFGNGGGDDAAALSPAAAAAAPA